MAKYTIEEFKYLLGYHKIKAAPVWDGKQFLGEIDSNLRYTHSNCMRYYTNKNYAIEVAINFLDEYIEAIKKFRSSDEIEVRVEYHNKHEVWEYADSDGVVRHHVYPRTQDDVTNYVWKGTYDMVFEKFYKSNNTLRYCNGHYYEFPDKELQTLYLLWMKYIPESRSFNLYYGDGIVD